MASYANPGEKYGLEVVDQAENVCVTELPWLVQRELDSNTSFPLACDQVAGSEEEFTGTGTTRLSAQAGSSRELCDEIGQSGREMAASMIVLRVALLEQGRSEQ